MVVKVTKVVSDLSVKKKGVASSTTSAIRTAGEPVQGGLSLGQEGRDRRPSLLAPPGAASGHMDLAGQLDDHASLGQESQGLPARRTPSRRGLQLS